MSDADLYNQRIIIKEKIKETEQRLEAKIRNKGGFYSRQENITGTIVEQELTGSVSTLEDAQQVLYSSEEAVRTLMEKMGIGQGKLKDTYLLECEPSINIDKNNRPNHHRSCHNKATKGLNHLSGSTRAGMAFR